MADGDRTACFKGEAALGAWREGDGFRVYCVDHFGFCEPGRFSAAFSVYGVGAPVGAGEMEDMLVGECGGYYACCDEAARLEACERYDCAPSGLGAAMAEELLADNGGDVYAAYRELHGDMLALSEGEPRVEMVGGGQADEFGKLGHLFADAALVEDVGRLWRAHHLSDMRAGTPAQEAALERAGLKGADYGLRVRYLEEAGLLEDEWDGAPYRYGSGWLDWGVPEADAARIGEVASALAALPGPSDAAALYIAAHPDCFEGGR